MASVDRAQSESIGTILLVGVVVVLVGLVGAFVLSGGGGSQPLADVQITGNASGLTLTHQGGDAIPRDELRVTLQTDDESRQYSVGAANLSGGNDEFELGDAIRLGHHAAGESARVLLVHTKTNSVIAEARVQLQSPSGSSVAPRAAFTVSPRSPTVGQSTTFDGSGSNDPDGAIAAYEWDFDDDGTTDATGRQVTHAYSSAGTYTAVLTVTDASGDASTVSKSVTVVTSAPSASFTYSPASPSTGETVSFDGSGSSDPDGTIATYAWDFDGDGTTDATGVTATTSFASAGSHDVALTVTDGDGNTDTATKTVQVTNAAPTASFTYSPSDPDTQDAISFTASASDADGSVTGYEWTFGDGATATGQSVSHGYADDGSYDVTLTVTDDDGATTTVTKTVQVDNVRPKPTFTVSPDPRHTNEPVTFDASGSTDPDGTVQSYAWDLDGDGTTDATGRTTAHQYLSPGRYNVTLTVTDDDSATNTTSQYVEVGGFRYTGSAATYEGSQRNTDSIASLGVNNNASTSLYVTNAIVTATGSATYIRSEGYPYDDYYDAEFYLLADQWGFARRVTSGPSNESGYSLGERFELRYGSDGGSVAWPARVDGGSSGTVYLIEFVREPGNSGNYDPVDMSGETVTVTFEFTYADGYSDTETVTVDLP